MGRQSARIVHIADGVLRDHKDIIGCYDGKWYHHDALYHGAELVWEKLKGGGGAVIASPLLFQKRKLHTRTATTMYFSSERSGRWYYDERLQERWNMEQDPFFCNGNEYLSEYGYLSDDLKSWRQIQPMPSFTNFGTYLHRVYKSSQWNYESGTPTYGIYHYIYSILGNDVLLLHSYFITDSLITEKTSAGTTVDYGCFGEALFIVIFDDEQNVKLCVLNDNTIYHTIFNGELLNRITRGKPLYYYFNIFYGKTAAYMLSNELDATERTLYKIGKSGMMQETYTFDVGTTEFLSPYVYRDRFVVMCTPGTDTIYIYDMMSGMVTSHKFDGYEMDFEDRYGLANICYENGNGLNIVLKDDHGRMALVILDLQGGQDGNL